MFYLLTGTLFSPFAVCGIWDDIQHEALKIHPESEKKKKKFNIATSYLCVCVIKKKNEIMFYIYHKVVGYVVFNKSYNNIDHRVALTTSKLKPPLDEMVFKAPNYILERQ